MTFSFAGQSDLIALPTARTRRTWATHVSEGRPRPARPQRPHRTPPTTPTTRRWRRAENARGQSLVEFALILPIFMVLIIGFMEFTVAMSAMLNINFASRDAALLAAEAGDTTGADCVILASVDADVGPPSADARIQSVEIFRTDANGNRDVANVYERIGSTTCDFPDGTSISVPYLATTEDYPVSQRCPVVAGCGTQPLDTIGVSITYQHNWMTPIASVITLGGDGFEFTRTNAMRMEPVL